MSFRLKNTYQLANSSDKKESQERETEREKEKEKGERGGGKYIGLRIGNKYVLFFASSTVPPDMIDRFGEEIFIVPPFADRPSANAITREEECVRER